MKIGIISGSHRENSQSLKVAKYIEQSLINNKYADDAWIFSLAGNRASTVG